MIVYCKSLHCLLQVFFLPSKTIDTISLMDIISGILMKCASLPLNTKYKMVQITNIFQWMLNCFSTTPFLTFCIECRKFIHNHASNLPSLLLLLQNTDNRLVPTLIFQLFVNNKKSQWNYGTQITIIRENVGQSWQQFKLYSTACH